jgi:hypothetical protein
LDSGDFDGDGYIDLMFTYSESTDIGMKTNGTVNLLFNDGKGVFGNETMIARHCSADPYDPYGRINPQLTTADYDMDGDIDFLVGDNSGQVEFYVNNGSGNFTSAGVIHDFGQYSCGLTSADYDLDGDMDFFVAAAFNDHEGEGYVYLKQNKVIESNASIVFDQGSGETLFQYGSVRGAACLRSIDYNNDSDVDLILGRNDELCLCLKKQDDFEKFPLNKFALPEGFTTNDIRLGGLTVADYNKDGREDLAAGGVDGNIRMLWNNYSTVLPPLWPKIIQPTGEYDPGVELEFGVKSQDMNGDDILYQIDWGDGSNTGWIGPYPSGEEIRLTHAWDKEGGYWVRAKAKDTRGAESGWNNYRLILTDDRDMSKKDSIVSRICNWREKKFSSYEDKYYVYREELQLPYSGSRIPWINVDWFPARKPYDIP